MKTAFDELLLYRSDPQCRAVLEDALLEEGRYLINHLPYLGTSPKIAGAAGGASVPSEAEAARESRGSRSRGDIGSGGDIGDGSAIFGGDGGGGGIHDGDGVGCWGGDGDFHIHEGKLDRTPIKKEINMYNGLKIWSIGGGYYVYLLVGWARCVKGDEWQMHNARIIRQQGGEVSLATLADKGPQAAEGNNGATELLDASVEPEEIHRLLIRRSLPCNEAAWKKHCPKPKNWID